MPCLAAMEPVTQGEIVPESTKGVDIQFSTSKRVVSSTSHLLKAYLKPTDIYATQTYAYMHLHTYNTHIHTYNAHTLTHIHTYIYIHTHKYMHTHIHAYIYIHTHTNLNTWKAEEKGGKELKYYINYRSGPRTIDNMERISQLLCSFLILNPVLCELRFYHWFSRELTGVSGLPRTLSPGLLSFQNWPEVTGACRARRDLNRLQLSLLKNELHVRKGMVERSDQI